jgi:hypothetical protein
MTALNLNPFLTTAPLPGAVSGSRRPTPLPRMAKLPVAPINASPVPHLTSLYHNDDPGTWGDRRYPGNCSGHLIRDLLKFYRVNTVYDPMAGSGTCGDVCRDLGIYCWSGDVHEGFDACEPRFSECFDFVWIHPPYWRMKEYASDPRDLSREPTLEGFLRRYDQLIRACAQAVKPGGHLAILMGDYSDRTAGYGPLVHHTKVLAFAAGLRQCVTDIIRFSHNASSSRKVYKSSFIPGLHDVCVVFTKVAKEAL